MTVGELIEMQNYFNDLSNQSDEEIIRGLIEDKDAMLELARGQREHYVELSAMSINDFEKFVHWAKEYVRAQRNASDRGHSA